MRHWNTKRNKIGLIKKQNEKGFKSKEKIKFYIENEIRYAQIARHS